MNRVYFCVAAILHVLWFKQKDVAFFFGAGTVTDTFGDDDTFAFAHNYAFAAFKIKNKLAFPTEEHLVLMLMGMKRIFNFDFGELELLFIQLRDDFWPPMLSEF